jgi:SHS2 domain-containing protein
MRPYKTIDHTGDVGIKVYGKSLPELFQNAAHGLFDIILKKPKIQGLHAEKISVTANDVEQLLVTWLSEFLYLFDTKRLVFGKIAIDKFEETAVEATAEGEIFDPKKHVIQTEIKAVTYHGLKIGKKGSLYTTLVIFDI